MNDGLCAFRIQVVIANSRDSVHGGRRRTFLEFSKLMRIRRLRIDLLERSEFGGGIWAGKGIGDGVASARGFGSQATLRLLPARQAAPICMVQSMCHRQTIT